MPELSIDLQIPRNPPMRFELRQKFEGLVVIIGPNGAGKTSFLEALHGLHGGQVFWDGQDASSSKSERGFVAQKPLMLSGTVRRNLEIACEFLGMSTEETEDAISRHSVDAAQWLDRPCQSLSTGQLAQVALWRAKLNDPKILLLDEVTANLDPKNTLAFEDSLRNFANEPGNVAFFVTHNVAQARRLAKVIIFVFEGEIIFSDVAERFWQSDDPKIRAYLAGEL